MSQPINGAKLPSPPVRVKGLSSSVRGAQVPVLMTTGHLHSDGLQEHRDVERKDRLIARGQSAKARPDAAQGRGAGPASDPTIDPTAIRDGS